MNTEIKQAAKRYTKAEDVVEAYYAAQWDNISSEGCYSRAVETAHKLGGIEIANSNDGNHTISFAPTVEFEFDDLSSAWVSYGGACVIATNQTDHHHTDKQ